jgi:hypothetical protein
MVSEVAPLSAFARLKPWAVMLTLLALVGVGFWVRVDTLGAADLTEDEELATGLPLISYGEVFTDIAGRPPLAFLAQKAYLDVAGEPTPFNLRMPGVIEGTLTILLLFALVQAVAGARAGLMAAALLAFNSFHMEWCRDARYYPMLALTATLCLWGLWRGGVQQKPTGFVLFLLGAAGVALTHFAGFLFLASVFAVLPFFLLLPQWRRVFTLHPRRTLQAAGAFLLAAGAVAFLLRGSLQQVTKHIAWPDLSAPLPPLFDVTPEFLGNRFIDMMSLPSGVLLLALLFVPIGLIGGSLKNRLWPILSLGILVVPFALFYLFPPDHPWNTKYFIFMLPVLVANMAMGINFFHEQIPSIENQSTKSFLWLYDFCTFLLFVTLFNFSYIDIIYNSMYPNQAHQTLGPELDEWSADTDAFYCTWKERPRILRHYSETLSDPARLQLLRPDAPFPEPPNAWFLLDGKTETSDALAGPLLSACFSRVAYQGMFLAHAPNAQEVQYGVCVPGQPDAAGPLSIEAGSSHLLTLLLPRDGTRAVVFDIAPGAGGEMGVTWGDGAMSASVPQGGGLVFAGVGTFTRGMLDLLIEPSAAIQIRSIGLVPVVGEDCSPEIPAWDFLSLTGLEALGSVWPEQARHEILLRDMRHGQAVTYRVYNEQARKVRVHVRALNDAPLANRYQVVVPGPKTQYDVLAFDEENGEVSMRETKPFDLPAGMSLIQVGYIGVSEEDYLRETRNGRARTQETLQNPGLASIQVVAESQEEVGAH